MSPDEPAPGLPARRHSAGAAAAGTADGSGTGNRETHFRVSGKVVETLSVDEIDRVLSRLGRSSFRSRFSISRKDRDYAAATGMEKLREHAAGFLSQRLRPDNPKDGRQTPMRGHPVFTAQHATACCCRGCMCRWYGIPPRRDLTAEELGFFTALVMRWIELDLSRPARPGRAGKKTMEPEPGQLELVL